jgi:hypothetical protein
MEMEKFKLLQFEEKKALLLQDNTTSQIQLTE